MIRTLALVQTTGILLLAAGTAGAQCADCTSSSSTSASDCRVSGCPCDSYSRNGSCENCDDNGFCSLCSGNCMPHAGWNPPARLPINRNGIWYRNYWPQAWYGNPGGGFHGSAPMVYQPTDTTQLGYSYARVPTWRRASMIPPTPCPSAFHARVCIPHPKCSRVINGCPPANPCQYDGNQGCPSCQQGYAMDWSAPQKGTVINAPVHAIHIVSRPATSAKEKRAMFSLTSLRNLFE